MMYRIKPKIAEQVRRGIKPGNWGMIPRSLIDVCAFKLAPMGRGFALDTDECKRIGIDSLDGSGSWWISKDWVMPAISHKLDLI
jgi:hypothetical protein